MAQKPGLTLPQRFSGWFISAAVLFLWWFTPRFIPPLTFIVLCIGFCWWTALLVHAGGADRSLWRLIWAAAGIRLAAALFFYFASTEHWPFFQPLQHSEPGFWNFAMDAVAAHRYALGILSHWNTNAPYPIFTSAAIEYYFVVAWVYRIFGPHPLYAILINVWFSTMQVLLGVWILRRLASDKTALRGGLLIAFWPSAILWSSQLLKDSLVATAVLGSIAACILLWESTQRNRLLTWAAASGWAGLIFSIAAVTKFRSYIGITLAVSIGLTFFSAFIFSTRRKPLWRSLATLGIAGAALLSMAFTYQYPYPQRWVILDISVLPLDELRPASSKPIVRSDQLNSSKPIVRSDQLNSSKPIVKSDQTQKINYLQVLLEMCRPPSFLILPNFSKTRLRAVEKSRRLPIKKPAPRTTPIQAKKPAKTTDRSIAQTPNPQNLSVGMDTPATITGEDISFAVSNSPSAGTSTLPEETIWQWPSPLKIWPEWDCMSALTTIADYSRAFYSSFSDQASLNRFMQTRKGILSAGGNSTLYSSVLFTTPADLVRFSPRAFLVAWFAPFPSQWLHMEGVTGPFRIFGGMETLFFYLLIPWILRGGWQMVRHGQVPGGLILFFITFCSLILGLCIPNAGTLFRLRLPLILLCLLLAGWGTESLTEGKPKPDGQTL